ncbi:hypothetical protein HanRHA438_Chr01g0031451 [Helianthus annuus]|nr:hypothetical protein HanRHA438_Chr01g0031451 [Helianthus annuus]
MPSFFNHLLHSTFSDMDFGLALLRLCVSFYTCPFPTLLSYLFHLHIAANENQREKERIWEKETIS